MTACLNIAAFLGLSAALACKYRECLVTVVPVSTAALILVLFALAFFRALCLIDILAGFTLAACAVFFVRTFRRDIGRELLKALFSPSSVVFYCIVLLAFFLMRNIPVACSDDLGCWALEAKSIFFYDGFAPKFRNAAYSYGRYFPGTSLFRWWVCHLFGQFRDGFLFVGSGWLFVFLLSPVLACCTYSMAFAPLSAVAGGVLFLLLPGTINHMAYLSIGAEALMGAAFAGAFIVLFSEKRDISRPLLASYLFLLCFFKLSGVFFTLVVLLFCLIYACGRRSVSVNAGEDAAFLDTLTPPHELLKASACFVPSGIWYVYCLFMQRSDYFTASLETVGEGSASLFIKSYIQGFLFEPAHFTYDGIFDPPLAVLLLIIALIAFAGRRAGLLKGEKYRVLAKYMAAVLVIYLLGMLTVHCVVFRETLYFDPAYMAASISGYGMPIFLGVLIFLLYRMLAAAGNRVCRLTVLSVFMALAVSCTCLWTVYYRVVNTDELNAQTETWHSETAAHFDGALAQARENENGRILLIYGRDQIADYVESVRLRYLAAPCSVVTFELDTESGELGSRLAELEDLFEQSHPSTVYIMQVEEELLSELVPQWLASGVTIVYE